MATTKRPKAEHTLASRKAVLMSWADTPDRTARTQPGRDAFRAKFDDQVDPDRILEPEERARRADFARRAYYADLALKSAKARRKTAS